FDFFLTVLFLHQWYKAVEDQDSKIAPCFYICIEHAAFQVCIIVCVIEALIEGSKGKHLIAPRKNAVLETATNINGPLTKKTKLVSPACTDLIISLPAWTKDTRACITPISVTIARDAIRLLHSRSTSFHVVLVQDSTRA
ncbi:hypothetical protein V1477_021258, partial [Vespula maculifrons]